MIIFPQGIEISESDVLCLKNDTLSIEDWVRGALAGKVSNCKKRLFREWYPRLLDVPDVSEIPGEEDALIAFIIARPDYQDRSERERMDVSG